MSGPVWFPPCSPCGELEDNVTWPEGPVIACPDGTLDPSFGQATHEEVLADDLGLLNELMSSADSLIEAALADAQAVGTLKTALTPAGCRQASHEDRLGGSCGASAVPCPFKGGLEPASWRGLVFNMKDSGQLGLGWLGVWLMVSI